MRMPRPSVRRLMILVALVAVGFGCTRFVRRQWVAVEEDAWVGYTQDSIVRWMGRPTEAREFEDNIANEPRPIIAPPGPRRTLGFKTRRGHLWVWLRPVGSGWECYDSLWFRDGVRF
jgi:hypothetical protein